MGADSGDIPEPTPAARRRAAQRLRRAYWNVRLFGLSPLRRDVWMLVVSVLLFLALLAIQGQFDARDAQQRALERQQQALVAQQQVLRKQQDAIKAQQDAIRTVQRQLVRILQPTRAQRRRLLRQLLSSAGPRERSRLGRLGRPPAGGNRAQPPTGAPPRRPGTSRPPQNPGGGRQPAPPQPAPQPTLPPLPGLPSLPDHPCVLGICLPVP